MKQTSRAAIENAEANVASRKAILNQIRSSVLASQDETRALLQRVKSALQNLQIEFERADKLFERGFTTRSILLDEVNAALDQISLSDHAMIDRKTRNVSHEIFDGLNAGQSYIFETRGRTLTIMRGASGSGKTTLLTLIGCLRRVEEGNIRLLGNELQGVSESMLVHARRNLGFIFQAHNLHESLTAMQNVRMGLEVHGRAATRNWEESAKHLLGLVGLSDRLHYLPGSLSGGQKQRVAVARALVGNPEIVFADEPTAALDKISGLQVVEMLRQLGQKRGTTTLMVTHDNRITDLADRVITLDDGRIIADERPAG